MTDARPRSAPMSADRWQRVQDLFAAAIECELTARAQFLLQGCGDDAELRREVESLLASHEKPGAVDRLAPAIAPAAAWARAQIAGWEGRRVRQYLVQELLDTGGMGVVYKAHDARLDRHVALKFLSPHLSKQPASKQRFLVEARAAAALDDPHICTILEIGETEDGQLFIVMPLYDGETVQARLKRGRLPFDDAIHIAVQIARGVGRAHAGGVVHRDIKPSNVMLLPNGTVKILDFGIASTEALSAAPADARFGTLPYMSPEHLRSAPIDRRSDVWSLGVLVHEMLTGVRPFYGDDAHSLAEAIFNREPDLVATSHPDVPAGIDRVLRRALAKQVEDRYPSMGAFAADLTALLRRSEPSRAGSRFDAPIAGSSDPAGVTERRRAAVLVTMVSEYGVLVESLTPVDAERLVAQIRDLAVDIVRRHGGHVNQAIGEEIVSVFGVVAAHDDDELRAVRAALELHGRVRELAAEAGWIASLRIQSGLHVGSVVAQRLPEGPRRYALVGAPSHLASRLAALAAPGDVVLSPECQRVLSPFVDTSACAAVVLEPGAPAVTPFRVTGETGLETRLEASEQLGLTPYIGREGDLALLQRCVEEAEQGAGRVIEVVGEAGIGKSRLLHELRERVLARNVTTLKGRCRAFGDVAPYCPFIEIVRSVLRLPVRGVIDSSELVARVREIDASLEPFVPVYLHLLSVHSESHPIPRHLQAEHLEAALVEALTTLFIVLSQRTTLVVVLEDWHCSDGASRAVLGRMRGIVSAERIVCIVTSRPEPAVFERPSAGSIRMALEPLDYPSSTALIGAGLRAGRVSEALVRRLFERTGGNPFFLEQVCRALVEQGAVSLHEDEAVVNGELSLPDTVQAVIRTRLDHLEPQAREVARVASAFGREFEYALLADVVWPDIDLAAAMGRLCASGLTRQTTETPRLGYRFTHVLTQEVSYESLLAHQRKSLHEAIGGAIERHHPERLDEQAALLAHHYSRAEAWREAVHYGRRAADRAGGLSQFADALDALDKVLEWLPRLPDDEERRHLKTELLLQQERACETTGLRRRQQQIIGRLIAHLAPAGPSARLAETYLREGDLLTLLKRFNGADRALTTALRISRELDDSGLERNILRSVGLLRWHEGRNGEALALTESALAIDREREDDDAVAGDLVNLANILKSMGEYSVALSKIQEALAMPSLAQSPKKLAYVLHNLANVHRCMGDLDATLSCLRRANEITGQLLPIQRSFHLTSIAHIELQQGSIEAAIHTYKDAIELSRRARHAPGLAHSLRTLGEVLLELGRHEEAVPYLGEAAELLGQLEDATAEAEVSKYAATARERAGWNLEALEAWQRVQSLCRQLGDARGQLDAMEGIARAIRKIDGATDGCVAAFEAALELASTLRDERRALACRNTLGIVEWARENHATALLHYEAALLLARGQEDRVQEGVVLNSLGVTLSKLNRPEEARTVLEESAALNRQTGERLLEAHAHAGLGHVSRSLGRFDRAAESFERSLELRRAAGDRVGEAWMWRRLAETRATLGKETAARDAADAAATLAAATGDAELIAACADPLPATQS